MSNGSIICPQCGLESGDEQRFCRKCGTDLRAVRRALSGELPDDAGVEEAGRRARLRLVRGVCFLVLAAGFGKVFLALLVAAFGLAGFGLLQLIALALFTLLPIACGGLAVRDFLTAYELKRNPRAAVLHGDATTARLTSPSPLPLAAPLSSVVDHTTFPLDHVAADRVEAPKNPAASERE